MRSSIRQVAGVPARRSGAALSLSLALAGCSLVDTFLGPGAVPPLESQYGGAKLPAISVPGTPAGSGAAGTAPDHTEPTSAPAVAGAPDAGAEVPDPLAGPYKLDMDNAIRLLYANSARVTAAREEMLAAQYGLEEFTANLSRLEPFIDTRANIADFPNREGAFGHAASTTAGLEKETFGGALLRAEAGGSMSRFRFDAPSSGPTFTEDGSGALLRARVEVPFFGSRRKQNRVIQRAFQESTARKAQLDYLQQYRSFVSNALSYYSSTVYYRALKRAYRLQINALDALLNDRRLRPEDRARVASVKGENEGSVKHYSLYETEYLTSFLAELGLNKTDDFEVVVPGHGLSPYALRASSPESLERLIDVARDNNPTFKVLRDAIADAELQRAQAIKGKYDITAFVEGTHFPFGSQTFDDRFEGWTIEGGLTFRLNDRRVLDATRRKAEAQIRQFHALLQAEEIDMRQLIISESQALLDGNEHRDKLLTVIEQKRAEFDARLAAYFEGEIDIDAVLESRNDLLNNETRLASNLYQARNREANLIGATGRVYEIAGLDIEKEVEKALGVEH